MYEICLSFFPSSICSAPPCHFDHNYDDRQLEMRRKMLRQKLGGSYESHDAATSSSSSSNEHHSSTTRRRSIRNKHGNNVKSGASSATNYASPRRTQSVRINPIVRLQNENGQPVRAGSAGETTGDGMGQLSQSTPKMTGASAPTSSPIAIPR